MKNYAIVDAISAVWLRTPYNLLIDSVDPHVRKMDDEMDCIGLRLAGKHGYISHELRHGVQSCY
jgi:hypothetical protein